MTFADLLFIPCPLCGRDEADEYGRKEGFRIMRCRACRLVYVNPRLPLAALDRMYNAQTISSTQYYVQSAADDAPSFHRRLHWIEKHREPGRLLDIGCGPGTFMSVARERGWKARGVDINKASVERCVGIGLDAIHGSFPHPALADERFDAIVLNDVIEHLPEPKPALSHVRSMLAPGGIVFLSTPDIGAAVAKLSGVRWLHLKPIEHLTYFDRRTIARMLGDTGFEVVRVGAIGRNRSLGLLLERLATYNIAVSRAALRLMPPWATHVSFPVNPGDEMAVLARR